ncbi:MAG: hypothetical protein ACI8RZ_000240 [Myxococcota bacterium]|jgi:hypothetical protein
MSVSKAQFCAETGTFPVQYNPVNFKFDKPVSWKEHDEQGQESKLEFQKSQPANISMELIYDTTNSGSDVRQTWVDQLLALTNPVIPDEGDTDKMRPPKVDFEWGSFCFTGVVESVNATYTMFAQSGNPLRAKVQLKMKEWTPDNEYSGGGGADGLSSTKIQLVTVQAGQSLSQIASSNNTTQGAIQDANPQVSDWLNLAAGSILSVFG